MYRAHSRLGAMRERQGELSAKNIPCLHFRLIVTLNDLRGEVTQAEGGLKGGLDRTNVVLKRISLNNHKRRIIIEMHHCEHCALKYYSRRETSKANASKE